MAERSRYDYRHVTVRSLCPDDAQEVQQILYDVWRETYVNPGWMTPDQLDKFADPDQHTARQKMRILEAEVMQEEGNPEAARYLGAELDKKIGGILKWYPQEASDRFSGFNTGDPEDPLKWKRVAGKSGIWLAYVEEIDVLYRRRKIGSALFHSAIQQIRHEQPGQPKLAGVELDVVYKNNAAKAFYQSIGLQSSGLYSYFPGLRGQTDMVLEAMNGSPQAIESNLESSLSRM